MIPEGDLEGMTGTPVASSASVFITEGGEETTLDGPRDVTKDGKDDLAIVGIIVGACDGINE